MAKMERDDASSQASPENLNALGEHALSYIEPGFTVGIGTGRAASAFIRALGRSAIKVRAVPTSEESAALARQMGIELCPLKGEIDIAVDGADEVDPQLNLIKGYGGALLREKVVAAASRYYVILVGEEKLVTRLGERGLVPVEVLPFAVDLCISRISALGLRPRLRVDNAGKEFFTDNGNLILDCVVDPIADPENLDRQLRAIPGVLGTGLFINMAHEVLVCRRDGQLTTLKRNARLGN